MRCQTTIVEMNEERCLELSDLLPHATIIHGDGTDPEVLHEAGFNCCDAAVLLSSMDEENFVLAMYAETFDTPKIICKINRDSYASILQKALPEATIISPKNITAEEIINRSAPGRMLPAAMLKPYISWFPAKRRLWNSRFAKPADI